MRWRRGAVLFLSEGPPHKAARKGEQAAEDDIEPEAGGGLDLVDGDDGGEEGKDKKKEEAKDHFKEGQPAGIGSGAHVGASCPALPKLEHILTPGGVKWKFI